jgi:ATP adenylyltransferase
MNKEFLYSPWRFDYIQGDKPEDCILCRHQDIDRDIENLIVSRSKLCYVMLNRYPYNNGHIMIVPYVHCKRLQDLREEVLSDIGTVMQNSEQVLSQVYNCDGINIGINIGKAAGAGLDEHLHIHMVPRWVGDCNFMSIVGGQRVIPEAFDLSYTRLRDAYINILNSKE